jgi:thermitase
VIEQLLSMPEVLYAEPNGIAVHQAIPNDPRFNEQWGLRNTINPGADIHAEAAWDVYTGSSNSIIAIIDGGVERTHADLNSKMLGGDVGFGWDGHGTHVAGIAAAATNNGVGIAGVDWNASIHPKRIDNIGEYSELYQAIVDAVDFSPNVLTLNNSFALWNSIDNVPAGYSTTVALAYAYVYKANRTSVAAMGNHQIWSPNTTAYPAGYNNVIAVGATNNGDVIADFSVHGNHIDVCAPGVDILSTFNGGYGFMSGTSMATPYVSGIASLLKGFMPQLANDDIRGIIRLSADTTEGMNGQIFSEEYGYGRANAARALELLQKPYQLKQWSVKGGTSVSSTNTYLIQFMGASGLASANYTVKRYEVQKTVTFPSAFYCLEGAWGRGVSTTGWSQSNPNFGEGFCEIVPGTHTSTGATLRTYVYQVWNTAGQYLG